MARIFHDQSNHGDAFRSDRYPDGVPNTLKYPDIPAWGLLDRAARLMPGRTACHYNDVQWTWEEVNLDAIRTAVALRRLGVQPGDRVGILLPNIPEYLIALNGIWRAQAVAVALSPLATQKETDRMLEATDCRLVICLDMLADLISGPHRPVKTLFVSLRPRLPLFEQVGYVLMRRRKAGFWWMSATEHVGWFWDELMADALPEAGDRVDPDPVPEVLRRRTSGDLPRLDYHDPSSPQEWEDAAWDRVPAYILPTGGTTGTPKAVTLSHANLVANAWQQFYWAGATIGQETLLAVLPFFHSYGLSTNLLGGAAMVATLIMDHRFQTRKVMKLIERHRPTVFHAVPAMLVAINEQMRQRPADLTSLKWVISGGAPLPVSVGAEFAEYAEALVVEGYGLSEASPVTHVGPLDGTSALGTIGLPLPDTCCRIVEPETGEDAFPGVVGELLVRGPQIMLGYWHEVAAVLDERGRVPQRDEERWLPTGDLVRLNPHGLFQVVERKKDLIITSGFNVYPQDVEAELKSLPHIKDAAVVGVPDDQKGELVKAFVVLESGSRWDEQAVRDHCCNTLAAHKRPRLYEVCQGDLPRSFLGKVVRRRLRDQESADKTSVDAE